VAAIRLQHQEGHLRNPSGCLSDLYPFVITNYTNQIDSVFDNPPAFDDNGGGNSMAFYNVQNAMLPC
jgi:hypothetical protein